MTQSYLQPDIITGGAITRILEGYWKNKGIIKNEDLKQIHNALVDNNVFGEVAKYIFIPIEKKIPIGDKLQKGIVAAIQQVQENKTKHVHLFENKGVILKDDIYGSAFGTFQYIYRSKGIRIHWFENGLIQYDSVYSKNDINGFEYQTEEIDAWSIFSDNEIDNSMDSPLDEAFGNGEILIANLVNIKEDFSRKYAIEYLLYPPDVEKLSVFSIKVREQIWDAIITLMKEVALDFNQDKTNLLTYLTVFVEFANISPAAYHVISMFDFYRENQSRIDEDQFLKIMSLIRKQSDPIDGNLLIQELEGISPGKTTATEYHNLIFKSLTQIFDNGLRRGDKEVKINEGRKRVDIVFDNQDTNGFFAHIRERNKIFCPYIFIECKNYSSDPSNPEVDQLLGRLGDYRGRFGILICREIEDEELLMKRCKDAMHNDKKYIIYLQDKDIKALLTLKEALNEQGIMDYLLSKWDKLILNKK
ncbi:hypothetical protein ABER75_10955 [Niallia taxi]|uniref:hypothetical protein n=1 Tax=Niallia taxi TaxID=2499688 RepID=UPI003D2C4524